MVGRDWPPPGYEGLCLQLIGCHCGKSQCDCEEEPLELELEVSRDVGDQWRCPCIMSMDSCRALVGQDPPHNPQLLRLKFLKYSAMTHTEYIRSLELYVPG